MFSLTFTKSVWQVCDRSWVSKFLHSKHEAEVSELKVVHWLKADINGALFGELFIVSFLKEKSTLMDVFIDPTRRAWWPGHRSAFSPKQKL